MNHTICVDASVAVRSALPEEGTSLARDLFFEAATLETRIAVPIHFHAEVASAIHKKWRNGELTVSQARRRYEAIEAINVESMNLPGLTFRALDLARELNQKYPYDALYLALGELLDCEVWTADARFHAMASPAYSRLKLLSEFEPGATSGR